MSNGRRQQENQKRQWQPGPVSYTHLDVYKRQHIIILSNLLSFLPFMRTTILAVLRIKGVLQFAAFKFIIISTIFKSIINDVPSCVLTCSLLLNCGYFYESVLSLHIHLASCSESIPTSYLYTLSIFQVTLFVL